jgi:hypothetical protein
MGGGGFVAVCAVFAVAWRFRPGSTAQDRERAAMRRRSRRLGGDIAGAAAEVTAREVAGGGTRAMSTVDWRANPALACAPPRPGPWPTGSGRLPGGRTAVRRDCAVCGAKLTAKQMRKREGECSNACRRVTARIEASSNGGGGGYPIAAPIAF